MSLARSPYLEGPYAPTSDEVDVALTPLEGSIPEDLAGVFVRNGPNPRFPAPGRHHWFDGDGMLHAVELAGGRARYRNRYVRTEGFRREEEAGRALWSGLIEPVGNNPAGAPYKDTSNTDVVCFGGGLLTLWYVCGAGYRVDAHSLETGAPLVEPDGRRLRLSAHAKVDRATGELLFFDYGPHPPFMRYGVIDRSGQVTHLTSVELPGPRLPHDMAVTERYSVLMDLPVYPRPEALRQKRWLVAYHRDQPARFGVIPRRGDGAEVRWFEAEPCYVYHVVNAWEEGSAIVMIGCRCDEPMPEPDPSDGAYARALANLRLRAHLHRWTFDLETGQTTEERLDDVNCEFPTIDDGRLGRRSRFGYAVTIPDTRTLFFDGIVKYDLEGDRGGTLRYGPGRFGSEAPFAPRVGATEEDDGYLLSFVDDRAADRSELWIVDARDVEAGPVARLGVPHRVPLGFHACWAPASELV